MPKIMAINAGSSSLKFQLLHMPEEKIIAKGLVERIGMDGTVMAVEFGEEEHTVHPSIEDHADAVREMLSFLTDKEVIQSLDDINGIGHRVVHGGRSSLLPL